MRGKSGGVGREVRERETLGSLYAYEVKLIRVMEVETGLMGQCNN
jgi:hypothetical protein